MLQRSIQGRRCFVFTTFMALACWMGPAPSLRAIVINEIMYHSEELDDTPFEWIEIYNEKVDPFDLSGFTICDGVQYEIPQGTLLDGFSYLVIASDVAAFSSKYDTTGMTVIGGWSGSLSNNGEWIRICNPGGVPVLEVRVNDRGKWPVAADGTGHSLSLTDPYKEIADADHWSHSLERQGTPGEWNGHTRQQGSGPVSFNGMDGAGFILDWLVLGPYTGWSNCDLGTTILRADWLRGTTSPRETDLVWRDGQSVPTDYSVAQSTGLHPNGPPSPRVEFYGSFSDTINFNDSVYPPDPDNVMAYAFVYVDNVTGAPLTNVRLACASDDAIAILVNGQSRHVNDACRAVGGGGEVQDRSGTFTLNPGKNLIAVKVFENGGGWSFRLRLEQGGAAGSPGTPGTPLVSARTIQVTTDVDAGLDFDGSGTPIIDPDDVGGGPPDPGTLPGAPPVVINEGFFRTGGERWIELYNRTSGNIDLTGYYLTDNPAILSKALIPNGTTISGKGYVSFTDTELGLDFSVTVPKPRVFVALVKPGGDVVADAFNFEPTVDGFSEARIPDGDREFDDVADPTRELPNTISANQDIVVNEVMYHPIDDDQEKEYIELYNRASPGSPPVDMTGWKLTRGFNFDFPDGTTMAPGQYLVIARNPELIKSIYGLTDGEVVGPDQDPLSIEAFGTLRDGGERITLKDHLERTVDTVRYWDGGQFARWADGHGSSLELIDPTQDRRFGQAWDASDDSAKAEVREFSYIGRHQTSESELHILLLNRGITVVDDLSIIGGGIQTIDTELIGDGETWRYLKGDQAPPQDWNSRLFNDSGWASGPTGIGYGDGDDATVLDDMQNSYLTVFCRKTFNVADPGAVDELVLSIVVDDGFMAYLNGVEVASFNVSGPNYDDGAISAGEPQLVERDISQHKGLLRVSGNVLAVQVHNAGLGSSDLSFIPRLVDRTTTVSGGTEQVTNGTFETGVSYWVREGTHWRSGRTTIDPITGNGSLKIIASGRGDNKVNRIETPDSAGRGLSNLNTNEDLQVSFKARWVVGSQTILTHGYEHVMAKSHELAVPEDLGTPARINSVTLRQISRNGGNLGPVISFVEQDLPVPGDGEDVVVRACVSDSDGIEPGSVRLRYSLNNPSAAPTSITMSDIGDGWYEATIPGRPLGTRVVFYITALDTEGVAGRYPVDITERTHPLVLNPAAPSINDHRYLIYRHDVAEPSTPYANYRFWMTANEENRLTSRRRLSNDLISGSFLFGSRRLYYESHTRFSGSPFARGGWGGSFRVTMPRDNRLHDTIRKMNLDNHHSGGNDARERISQYLIRHGNGGPTRVPYSDLQVMVRWQVNDRTSGVREHTWVPDVQFVDLWFPGEDRGDFLEMDDRFVIDDSGNRRGNRDGQVRYPPSSTASDGDGENKENYRWFFGLRAKNGADDFSSFIDFCEVMDPNATSNSQYDQVIWDVCNVENLLRNWSVRLNTDDWDHWGANRGKNIYFYRPDIEGRWYVFPWDLELTYGNTGSFNIPSSPSSAFNPGGFGEVHRMLNRPAIKRMYYAILDEMVNGANAWFTSSHLSPFMDKLAAIGMARTEIGQPGGFIDTRASSIRSRISSVVYPSVRLRITTNSGNDFSTDSITVDLAGGSPVEVASILVINNSDTGTIHPVEFTGMTAWRMVDIPLHPGPNDLELWGFDLKGNFVDSDAITVTSTAVSWPAPQLLSLTPDRAPPRQTVEIEGSDLHNDLRVFFGAVESPSVVFDENGPEPSTVVAQVPFGTGSTEITIRNIDGQISNPLTFTYEPWPAPQIDTVSPTEALPRAAVDIVGQDFHNGLRVFFGVLESPDVFFDEFGPQPTAIVAEVPSGQGPVQVTVRNIDGQGSNGAPFTILKPPSEFVRADANTDGVVDMSDAIRTLLHLFGGSPLVCEDAADSDDSGTLNITDAIFTLDFIFRNGQFPRFPFPNPGLDLTNDSLGCDL